MMHPYGTAGQVMYPGYIVRLPLSRLAGPANAPSVSTRFHATAHEKRTFGTGRSSPKETTQFF